MSDLSQVPLEDWEEARRKEPVIRELARDDVTRLEVACAADRMGVSISWTYELLERWRKNPRTSSLLPGKPGPKRGKSNIDPAVDEVIKASIEKYYATSQKPLLNELWEEISDRCRERVLKSPGKETVRRRLASADQYLISKKRDGRAKAQSKYGAAKGKFEAQYPLEVIQIDHTLVDVIIVDDEMRQPIGRPWLTVAIDIRTRMVVGYLLSLDPPSSLSVALTVSQAIWEKAAVLGNLDLKTDWPCEGIPTRIHVDNGKDFRAEALQRGCEEHGIILEFRPVATPWYGGHVERLLGTLMKEAHLLPGTTFSNVQEKGIYDSEKQSAMTFKELELWLSHRILGVYHNRLHSSLNASPISVWKSEIEKGWEPRKALDQKRLLLDFLPFELRKPRRDGLSLFSISYWHDLLPTWAAQDVGRLPVKYDPRDLSKVWLRLPDGQYAELRYKDPSRPPITLWEQRAAAAVTRENGRRSVNEEAVFSAVQESRQIVEEAKQASKAARRKSQRRASTNERLKATTTDQESEPNNDNVAPNYRGERKSFDVEFW